MSLNLRYIILTILLLGFLFLFTTAPTFTGQVTTDVTTCKDASDYDHCVECCQTYVNEIYGRDFYGTDAWSEKYNSCWEEFCSKFSKP